MRWFYNGDGEKRGPVSSGELKQLAENGDLLPDDLVMAEGDPQWKFAREAAPMLFRPRAADGALLEALATEREAEAIAEAKPIDAPPPLKREGIVCKVCDEGRLRDRSVYVLPLPFHILGTLLIVSSVVAFFLLWWIPALIEVALGSLCFLRKRVLECDRCGAAIPKL